MKTVLFIATLVSLTVVSALAQAQSDRRVVYFSSDRPRLVTLSQVGTDVVSFAVPVGTTMAVSYAANTEPNLSAPRFEAHGAIQVRLLRDEELHGRPQAEAMLTAPVVIGGDRIDLVVVERR
jgi:hypothetical protein